MNGVDVGLFGAPAFSLALGADGELRYLDLNDILCRQSGLVRDKVVGRTPYECFPAAIAEHVMRQYRHCIQLRSPHEYEENLDLPGDAKWWRTILSPLIDPATGVVIGVFGLASDITDRKRDEIELRSAAFNDPLTGICNRRRFDRDLDAAMMRAMETSQPFMVVVADVDRFKSINDAYGHAAGDAVLKEMARRLATTIGPTDRLARIGGDEFAAILSAESEEAVEASLQTMRDALDGPFQVGDRGLAVGLSLGAATWCRGMTTEAILASADAAMYRQKRAFAL